MTTEQEKYEELLRVVKEIKNSPAMNGAFDKLTESVEHIKNTQGKMCNDMNVLMVQQQEAKVVQDEMHTALYHPDNGIYKRINDSTMVDSNQEQHLGRLEKSQSDLNKEISKHHDRLVQVESTNENLKTVAGPRLENLDSVVKMNKNTKKLFLAGIGALIAFIIKEFGPTIISLLF